jgi:hypothetical protein
MLVKDSTKRCTWEYLFNVPLSKEGEISGDLKPYTPYNDGQYYPNNLNKDYAL